MNKIFKIIWSKVEQRFIVVSELARGQVKAASKSQSVHLSNSRPLLSTLCISLLSIFLSTTSYSAVTEGTLTGGGAIALGSNSAASNQNAIAIGDKAKASGQNSVAQGSSSKATHEGTIALGYTAQATNSSSLALGQGAKASGEFSSAIGLIAKASGGSSVALAHNSNASGAESIAVGSSSQAAGTSSTALGAGAKSLTNNSNAFGNDALANATFSTAVGTSSKAEGVSSIALGKDAHTKGMYSNALGYQSNSTGQSSVAIGTNSKSFGDNALAAGTQAEASNEDSIAIGTRANSTGQGGIALGKETLVAYYASALGQQSKAMGNSSVALGDNAQTTAQYATALGAYSKASAMDSISIGRLSNTTAANAIALGHNATAQHPNSIALGFDSSTQDATITNLQLVYKDKDGKNVNYNVAGNHSVGVLSIGNTTSNQTRQIQGVSAGRITKDSTDAINGSQLYYVATQTGFNLKGNNNFTARINNNDEINFINGNGTVANVTGNNITFDIKLASANGTINITHANNTINLEAVERENYFHTNTNDPNQELGNVSTNKGKIDAKAGATGIYAITGGIGAQAYGIGGVALGYNAKSSHYAAIALGANTNASGTHSVAMGMNATSSGSQATALGQLSKATKTAATALGSNARALESGSTAIGPNTEATAARSIAIGYGSRANRASFNDDVTTSIHALSSQNQVYASETASSSDKAAIIKTAESTLGALSIGSAINRSVFTRQITNVAAGSEDSDAVNVAQLKSVANAIQTAKTEIEAGDNVELQSKTGSHGQTVYTVNAEKTVVVQGSGIKVTSSNTGNHTTSYTIELDGQTQGLLTKEESVTAGNTNLIVKQDKLNDTQGKNFEVSLNNQLDLTQNGVVKIGETTLNQDGLTIVDGPSVTHSGINASNKKIEGVADGDISPNSKDAVNGSQLYALKQSIKSSKTTVSSTDKSININETNNGYDLSVNTGQADVVDGKAHTSSTDGSKVVTVGNMVETMNNVAWNINADKVEGSTGEAKDYTQGDKVKAGDTVTIKAGNNIAISGSGKNIHIATTNKPTFEEITATEKIEVKGGPSITKDGINMNEKRISNVAPGIDGKDVVNVDQLNDVARKVNNKIHTVDRDLRSGIAGAVAIGSLAQAYNPSESMLAVGGGTYRGASALALGYSRVSDNGKVTLKLTGSMNNAGHYMGGASVGFKF